MPHESSERKFIFFGDKLSLMIFQEHTLIQMFFFQFLIGKHKCFWYFRRAFLELKPYS